MVVKRYDGIMISMPHCKWRGLGLACHVHGQVKLPLSVQCMNEILAIESKLTYAEMYIPAMGQCPIQSYRGKKNTPSHLMLNRNQS